MLKKLIPFQLWTDAASNLDNMEWWLKSAKIQKTQDATQTKKDIKQNWGICITCYKYW